MTRAIVALNHATSGGVYYSANIDFATYGSNPTWAKYATTGLANTLIQAMGNDTYNPYGANGVFIQLDNDSLYVWDGAAWDLLLDVAAIETLVGFTDETIGTFAVDPSISGTLYVPISGPQHKSRLLKSDDYGASWSVITVSMAGLGLATGSPTCSAYGQNLIYSVGSIYPSLYFSENGGSTWTEYNAWPLGGGGISHKLDRHNPTKCYAATSGSDSILSRYTKTTATQLQAAITDLANNIQQATSDSMWIDPITANHHRIYSGLGPTLKIYVSTDQWATVNTPSALVGVNNLAVYYHALSAALENNAYIMFGRGAGANACDVVYGLNGETSTAAWNLSGANTTTPPYTDAIPEVTGGYVAHRGIFVGEAPASSGILVYSIEHDAFDQAHDPMRGSNASWRDMDANTDPDGNTHADIHAEDIWLDTPQRHNAWPASAGQASVSDGTKQVATDIATQAELNAHAALPNVHHDAVTLAADADAFLGLTGQQLTVDAFAANTFLGGPTSGAAADPTARVINIDHLNDVDMSGAQANDLLVYDGTNVVPRDPNVAIPRAWGSMYQDDTATVITVGAANTDYIVTGMSEGLVNNMTFQSGQELKIETAGVYKVDWSVSFVTASANQEVEGAVGVGGVRNAQTSSHARINTATDDTNIGGTGLLELAIDDLVQIVVRNETGSNNITIDHANLSLVFLGVAIEILTDSDGIPLTDSDGIGLTDSGS